jgi:UPF0755 protein
VKVLGYAIAALAGVAIVLALLLSYAMFWDRSHPVVSANVVIPNGASFDEVAVILRRDGVVANALPIHLLARIRGDETRVRAGEYLFAPHESASQVLHALVTQGAAIAKWVTIPEGFTNAQIAQRLQDAGLGNAAVLAQAFSRGSIVVDGTRTKSLEGFLFPDTYLVPVGGSPAEIEQVMEREFMTALPPNAAALARRLHVTVPQVVAVASLVEREAKIERDRPLIAGVIYNRLARGMPLQVDATIEYVLPHHKADLSERDLQIASPYNTYLHPGLPPTPIANPGKASLNAAFHPAATKALYYVYCGGGRHVFADTLSQHEANVARCLK